MARPLPVNLLLAGTGAVLLVSGLGGKPIGDVLKGDFSKLDVKNPDVGNVNSESGTVGGGAINASFLSSPGAFAPSPSELPPRPSSLPERAASPFNHEALLYNTKKGELENYLKRPLTAKEEAELADLARKKELKP